MKEKNKRKKSYKKRKRRKEKNCSRRVDNVRSSKGGNKNVRRKRGNKEEK